MAFVKKCVLLLVLGIAFNEITAQDECVDYGLSRFPRVIEGKTYQWNGDAWNFRNMKQKKVVGLNEANGFYKGLLEYLPPGFHSSADKYPIIIFFHGTSSAGDGTSEHLCRLFKDIGSDLATHKAIPGRVERETGLFTQTDGSSVRRFVVISAQHYKYHRNYPEKDGPNVYPGASEVEKIIDYILSRYPGKIDLGRVYLTGYSSGANMIMEYVGSSVERAKRIAAVMPISLCSQLGHFSNPHVSATNVGLAKLKTWFVYCQSDNCGNNVSLDWVTKIRAVPGHEPPRLTVLTEGGSPHPGLYQCSDTLQHDAWSRGYESSFRASFKNNGTPAEGNDGINKNMYEWFAQSQTVVTPPPPPPQPPQPPQPPPPTTPNFQARLRDKQVVLNWDTPDDKEPGSFIIERAGIDQKFIPIRILKGLGTFSGVREYSAVDNRPLIGLSFYRLVHTDIDGNLTYLDVQKVVNQPDGVSQVIVSPNPFTTEISAFLNVNKPQKVSIVLSDMTGKMLRTVNGYYAEGSSEVKMNSTDLPKGLYLLKVKGENFSSVHKALKR